MNILGAEFQGFFSNPRIIVLALCIHSPRKKVDFSRGITIYLNFPPRNYQFKWESRMKSFESKESVLDVSDLFSGVIKSPTVNRLRQRHTPFFFRDSFSDPLKWKTRLQVYDNNGLYLPGFFAMNIDTRADLKSYWLSPFTRELVDSENSALSFIATERALKIY